jgi:DNA-binding transcriptional regulator YhcF (GntR family)
MILKKVKVGDTAFKLAKRVNCSWFTVKRVLFYLEDQGKVKLEKDSPHKVLKVVKLV